MVVRPINGLALCAGIGGLELGLSIALGDSYRCLGYVEREAFAAAALVARMEDETLDQAPVWDDLATFDGRPWCGKVDLVSAGFPCQPFSQAGKRQGTKDERWLWDDIARILGEVRPGFVFLENVRGFLAPSQHGALAAVLGSLADLGFDAEWGVFSAAEVGAPHKRERFFLLAYRPELSDARRLREVRPQHRGPELGRDTETDARTVCEEVGDAHEPGLQGRSEPIGEGGNQRPTWPPGPSVEPADWPEGVPQPSIRRTSDGIPYRVDRLRCLGNGVVPLQAAYAFRALAVRGGLT